jgi:hypothetical protein
MHPTVVSLLSTFHDGKMTKKGRAPVAPLAVDQLQPSR